MVTGGTRGIGYAIVKKYLEVGASVVLCGSKESTANAALEKIKAEMPGADVSAIAPDLCDSASVEAAFKGVFEKYGRFDILANNAGISQHTLLTQYTDEEVDKILDVNIKAVFMCARAAARIMKENGVGCNIIRRKDCHGLESFVMVNPANGSRTKFPQRDTNPGIEWNSQLEEIIKGADILHLDGTNWENAYSAASIAKKHGVTISLDGCSMQKDNEKNIRLASMSDILIMNSKYPLRVSGKDTYEDALLEMSTWGPKVVVATLGNKGSLAVKDGKIVEYGIYKEENVLDTTGCGDVFHGAFLASWLEREDLDFAIKFAAITSGLKTRKMGGRAWIPNRDQVLEIIGNQLLWQQKRRNI